MKIDIHTHSRCSDGANTIEEMVAQAKKIGLGGIAITDHNTVEGALRALKYDCEDFKVIPGVEVSSIEGHILGLNIQENIPRGLSAAETVERIHELGGVAIAAHPYDVFRKGVGDVVKKVRFDALEAVNGHTFIDSRNVGKVAEKLGLPAVGGSDAHSIHELGKVSLEVDGDPIESILAGKVRIKADIRKLKVLGGMAERRFNRLLQAIY